MEKLLSKNHSEFYFLILIQEIKMTIRDKNFCIKYIMLLTIVNLHNTIIHTIYNENVIFIK